ncbi:MBL fold metallo-hydrolase [Aliikangiella sp. G2MR2-5]|uniref:MBL fold metallo-hydrolase n=1 Tax=Aliikangiella sp. G2MR2-5 TaxID=2788943 RepID=UPI0018AB8C79|nr:MBL fold metallo-hydrolase [Aliikangiella sp. G2MR2-5]
MSSYAKWITRVALIFLVFTMNSLSAKNEKTFIEILGVAQDAGYPQAGCYRPHCLKGWKKPEYRRSVVSLGLVDTVSKSKYLFEATPDLPEQLYQLEKIVSSEEFDLKGIFLTHAHIGHYTGLMYLGHESMGASEVPVFAMPRMSEFLRSNGPWSQLVNYKNIMLYPLQDSRPEKFSNIEVTPFSVPHREEYSEAVGFRIKGPSKTAIFIPDIDKWSRWDINISDLVKEVDYAIIDATFFDGTELPGRDMLKVPHPFVVESMDLFEKLSNEDKAKIWFIHFNHSNPLLEEGSQQSLLVRSKGFNIAKEGVRLFL